MSRSKPSKPLPYRTYMDALPSGDELRRTAADLLARGYQQAVNDLMELAQMKDTWDRMDEPWRVIVSDQNDTPGSVWQRRYELTRGGN